MQNNIIIEFYEYFIHDFNDLKKNIIYKFGDFTDSEDDKCGSIGIEGSIKNITENLSSCDPINSISGGGELEKKLIKLERNISTYDIDNLYENYKNFFVKYSTEEILNEDSINNIFENIDDAYLNQKNLFKNNLIMSEYIKKTENSTFSELINNNINDSILLKINLNKSDKIILIGDIHGSFHTFFRILCRLHRYDILNLEDFTLKDGYKLIFLGDILDRGSYSLDVIYLIFKLITMNNKTQFNVIYNRGNHETYDIFDRDGSNMEFKKKFGYNFESNQLNKIFTYEEDYDMFINKYLRLLNILPSAIILSIDNKNIWCCHGGFPRKYLYEKLEFTSDNVILFKNNEITMDIKWSDFGSIDGDLFGDSSRGSQLVKYTHKGTLQFLKENNINFIIRGHQDSIGNSVLFNSYGNKYIISKQIESIKGLVYNKNFVNNRTDGSIARLLPLELSEDYFKVLTISTNSDKKRYLQSDSFILLRFDIDYKIDEFKDCLKPFKIKKLANLLNSHSSINKSDLLKRNFNIIEDIMNIIDELLDNNIYSKKLKDKFIETSLLFGYINNKFKKIKNKLKKLMENYNTYSNLEYVSNYFDSVIDKNQQIYINNYINSIDKIIENLFEKIKKNSEKVVKLEFTESSFDLLDIKLNLIEQKFNELITE
jgi:hypothetical protein